MKPNERHSILQGIQNAVALFSFDIQIGTRMVTQNQASDFGKTYECAIFFQRPFSEASSLLNYVVNGLRTASEATKSGFGPKYRKIREKAFLRHFRPENKKHRTSLAQSTDVLHRKYGCLCRRSPMF